MSETPRETRVLNAVVSLVDTLLDDFDTVELLTDLTEHCALLLDVEAAGLLLADTRQHLHLMAATSERSQELELFQIQADEGPCLDCYAHGQIVVVSDLSLERQRWPLFVPAATDAGYVSVHAVPMRAGGSVLGALGLFGTHSGDLDEADLLVARTLAHIASVTILQDHAPNEATVGTQLRAALNSRVVVEQAKGYLRERFDISVEDAFAMLRQHARVHGQHLTQTAQILISDSDARPALLADLESLVRQRNRD
jgi:transcriptional regulator with GAF, ATPase, and Fis domain